jgi:hypothetical protein
LISSFTSSKLSFSPFTFPFNSSTFAQNSVIEVPAESLSSASHHKAHARAITHTVNQAIIATGAANTHKNAAIDAIIGHQNAIHNATVSHHNATVTSHILSAAVFNNNVNHLANGNNAVPNHSNN